MKHRPISDALYCDLEFDEVIWQLAFTPAVQRLRHVRLSNVDSLSLPGISGASRFEHALGAATVARHLGFARSLDPQQRLMVQAAALIHDTAITPYGHLVEEAFAYLDRPFSHESKWSQLLNEATSKEPGGAQSQVYLGRESGLRTWAESTFENGRGALDEIIHAVRGEGDFGPLIKGTLDVDNIDNVARAAYHMGLAYDRRLPLQLASSMQGLDGDGIIVDKFGLDLVKDWLTLRRAVYTRFMQAELDYSGKAMLLAATIAACEERLITENDWRLTDPQFTQRILTSGVKSAADPLQRWLLGDLWQLTDVVWMKGRLPSLPQAYAWSQSLTAEMGRCVAYRIEDKRTREVRVRLEDGTEFAVGEKPSQWLFAVALERRNRLSAMDKSAILENATSAFGCELMRYAHEDEDTPEELTLFDN